MADRSILAGEQWEPKLREAICASEKVVLLITPRSKSSLWVAAEAGAAWILEKELIPITLFIDHDELFGPLQRYQVRSAETPAQLEALITELAQPGTKAASADYSRKPVRLSGSGELFNDPAHWTDLIKIGEWGLQEGKNIIRSEGMYRYILSEAEYGQQEFTIRCRLRFYSLAHDDLSDDEQDSFEDVNAGIVFGWQSSNKSDKSKKFMKYHNILFSGMEILVEVIGSRGGDDEFDFEHLCHGRPFLLTPGREYDLIVNVLISGISVYSDAHLVYEADLDAPAVGRVGLRPWRSRLECSHFQVS
jgi:hypothetical protein